MTQRKLATLINAIEQFDKLAQQVSADYSVVESIRKALGPAITADAGKFLNERAVSSIPIRVNYNKPVGSFMVDATGSDREAVNAELKTLLDKKYGPRVSAMLSKLPEQNFEFGLLTVE